MSTMSEFHDNDYPISISVEAPAEDVFYVYGFPPSLPVRDEGNLPKGLGNLDDLLLGPSTYTPDSPFTEDSPESTSWSETFSPLSLDALSLNSPSSFFSSASSSPSFGAEDLTDDVRYVSPQDIMGDTYTLSNAMPYNPASNLGQWFPMEPLFDGDTDEAQSHALVALDELREVIPEAVPSPSSTLFGAQTMGLRIHIPTTAPSVEIPVPILHSPTPSPSPAPSFCSAPPSTAFAFSPSPEFTAPGHLGTKSPLPSSPSLSPTVAQKRLRRGSRSSLISNSVTPRHHPYKSDTPATKGAGEELSPSDFKQIVSFLRPFPQFANWNFDAKGLPQMVSGVVGSKKTREASENRRTTQEGGFCCIIPGCGSTITKKHNLRHHIVSHFILHGFECDVCKQGFNHHCSLVRHMKKCAATDVQSSRMAQSANKRGKRAKRL